MIVSATRLISAVAASVGMLAAIGAGAASAAQPVWTVTSLSAPTNLTPGDATGHDQIVVTAINAGDAPAEGAAAEIALRDVLPPGLTAVGISGESTSSTRVLNNEPPPPMSCTLATLTCTTTEGILPFGYLKVVIRVAVGAHAAASLQNVVSVSGGGAATVTTPLAVRVSAAPTEFGVERLDLTTTNEDGSPATQAGSHPFALTTTIGLNQALTPSGEPKPVALPKDLDFQLPAGLVGDPSAIPQCTEAQFRNASAYGPGCPDDTAIGVALAQTTGSGGVGEQWGAVYSLVPSPGEPARFGFLIADVPTYLDASVRTGGDYGVTVHADDLTQILGVAGTILTLWGVPGDPRHDSLRGSCIHGLDGPLPGCSSASNASPAPFLTLPSSCTGPTTTTVQADSWANPGAVVTGSVTSHDAAGNPLGLDGCDHLAFDPSILVQPDGFAASTPTGLNVDVHVPQQGSLDPEGLAQAEVRDTTVTLPAGVQLSPSGADGLQACSNAQIGFKGFNQETQIDEFTPGAPTCPDASKVGVVRIKTPLLPNELKGAVYLAAPQNFAAGPLENPFASLIALYIVAEDPVSGVLVKLAGKTTPDPVTGQLTTTFENTPQLPFEDLQLEFFGSARAPLTTPALCGAYTTTAVIAPWSGNAPVPSTSAFDIASGPDGAACSNPQPFAPGFQAGSTNLQAGAYTPFSLTMTRPDADQTLSRVEMQMPPGLLGSLARVRLCPEPQAVQGTCGEDSLVGQTVVSAGLGGDPYTVTGGKVYITGPYRGAPFGLSIVNPAVAGPFNLGTVVVRAQVLIDPHTAVLTIKSDPLPTILQGIPLQLQHVNVTVDRADGFTLNPTNCSRMAINGTLSSSEGASAPVSTPFQVTNCANLAFTPSFRVSTAARTTRAKGASLAVKLTYPNGPQGAQANIARVKVDLPRQLPARLTTLQKACTAAQFEANPAGCPAASVIGHARALTPILPVPLEGPAYFVSHGGEAFPSLVAVLQGYGVTVDLVGSTFIHGGITSSTFKTVPDVPVGTFELTLPQGKYSALAANLPGKARGGFCGQKLAMPTEFVAQNGAVIHESTKIGVTGCVKRTPARKAKRTSRNTRHRTHG